MSFAKTVKEELVTVPVELDEQLAEFSAFINLNGEFHIASRQKCLTLKPIIRPLPNGFCN